MQQHKSESFTWRQNHCSHCRQWLNSRGERIVTFVSESPANRGVTYRQHESCFRKTHEKATDS